MHLIAGKIFVDNNIKKINELHQLLTKREGFISSINFFLKEVIK